MREKLLLNIVLLTVHLYINAQESIIKYDQENNIAGIIYVDHNRPKTSEIPKVLPYPATGSYSPTHYGNPRVGVESNVGFCNYLYFPTDGKLKPGKQYTLKLKIKFDENYRDIPFYQDNFGIALTSYLYPNSFPSYWGLWDHTNEHLGIFESEKIVELEQEFRPLCTSKYVVLGVFKNSEMDHLHCFMCYYPFEVYDLSITESDNPNKACKYFGDEFKQEKQENFQNKNFNVYFDSGSSQISPLYNELIDSLGIRLNSNLDIVTLTGHTDKSGNNNVALAAARNNAVRTALINRGIDPLRIIMYNLADDKASDEIISTDRRVDIDLVKGEEHRMHYNNALRAIRNGDFPSAHKSLFNSWIHIVPNRKALSAYFDCWGESEKAQILKNELLRRVKEKCYKGRALNFELDSLKYEKLKGGTLTAHLTMLRMPAEDHNCSYAENPLRDSLLRKHANTVYDAHGFPNKSLVGNQASRIIPEIILTSDDASYLKKYAPLFKKACENRELPWPYYARIYDKLSIINTGFQRYGTVMNWRSTPPTPIHPYEDPALVDEYRRQVKLAPFTTTTSEYQTRQHSKLDKELVKQLNDIYKADQFYRNRVHTANRNFPRMAESDSINQIQVKQILDERGWLGPDIIGERGNTTLFLVIQHSDLETQLRYLPMMRIAVAEGNAKAQDLALLEDRVLLGQGKKQIYGSQIWKDKDTGQHSIAPLDDPDNVNIRRAKIGLRNIEDYISRWQLDWVMEKRKLKTKK